jgi:hypothetical protein
MPTLIHPSPSMTTHHPATPSPWQPVWEIIASGLISVFISLGLVAVLLLQVVLESVLGIVGVANGANFTGIDFLPQVGFSDRFMFAIKPQQGEQAGLPQLDPVAEQARAAR